MLITPPGPKQLLAEAGYPHGFKTNVVAASDGDMELLKIVQGLLADIGIDMEIRVLDVAEWVHYVEIEKRHDQLIYRPYGRSVIPTRRCGRSPVSAPVTPPIT